MEEIVKLVSKRNSERRFLSKEDIKKICSIMINGKKYNQYVKNIVFKDVNDKDQDTAGMYDGDNLYFYATGLNNLIEYNYNLLEDHIEGTKVDYANFFVLSIIFHELAHVRQDVLMEKKRDNEGKLYSICEKLHNIKDFYRDNYRDDLQEVNAFALGYMNACQIYSYLPRNIITPYDMSIYKGIVMEKVTTNYAVSCNKEIVISPSERLIDSADEYNLTKYNIDINKFKEMVNSCGDYSLYRKLSIGLPISFDSYSYVNMLYTCNNSREDIPLLKKLQHHK